jgi:hypothetical protein
MKQIDEYLNLLRTEYKHTNGQTFVYGLIAETHSFSLIEIFGNGSGNESDAFLWKRWQQIAGQTDNFIELVQSNPTNTVMERINTTISALEDLIQSVRETPLNIGSIKTSRASVWSKIYICAYDTLNKLKQINANNSYEVDTYPAELYTQAALVNLFEQLKEQLNKDGDPIIKGRSIDWFVMCEGRAPKKHHLTWNLVHPQHVGKKNVQALYDLLRKIGFSHKLAINAINVWFLLPTERLAINRYKHRYLTNESSWGSKHLPPLINGLKLKH